MTTHSAALITSGALLLLGLGVAGCGGATSSGSANQSSRVARGHLVLAGQRQVEVIDEAVERFPGLANPKPLSKSDAVLLNRWVPRQLPWIPGHTEALPLLATRGRYWIAPGVVTPNNAPGICVYSQQTSRARIGANCFNLKSVDLQKAFSIYGFKGGVDLVGLLPQSMSTVSTDVNSHRRTCPMVSGAYGCFVRGAFGHAVTVSSGHRRLARFSAAAARLPLSR